MPPSAASEGGAGVKVADKLWGEVQHMHAFFELLLEATEDRPLAAGSPEGTIVFHTVGADEPFALQLARVGCRQIAPRDVADLAVWLSPAQMDAMLREGWPATPLRFSGRRELLDVVAQLVAAGDAPHRIRARSAK